MIEFIIGLMIGGLFGCGIMIVVSIGKDNQDE